MYHLVFNGVWYLIYARSTNCAIQKVSERKSIYVFVFVCTYMYACYYSRYVWKNIKTTSSRSASAMTEWAIEINKVDGIKRIVVNYLHTPQQKHFILCTRPKIKLEKSTKTQTHIRFHKLFGVIQTHSWSRASVKERKILFDKILCKKNVWKRDLLCTVYLNNNNNNNNI